jgi:cell wall-associated NlpC family hydrolase
MVQLRMEMIEFAQQFVGLPYRYAGKSPVSGFDCSGFTSYILEKFDVEISRSSAYQSKEGVKIPLSEVEPGDLLFFGRKGRIQHVAMIVEHNANGIVCIHSTNRGIVVENVNTSSYWRPRILFARDVLGRRLFD